MIICRRCKKEFTPKHQEARCTFCLQQRRNNRIAKRRQDHEREVTHSTIRQLMTSNGGRKGASSKIIGMLH